MEKFKYLVVTVINTNDIRDELKRRISMGNSCYYSLEKILSSPVLSNKLKVEKMARKINSIVVRYMSWIAQLVRALARKAKGPGSSPGPG